MKEFGRIFKHKGLQFAEAVATLMGSTIGLGVLGMPFAVAHIGFFPGILLLFALGFANVLLQLMFAQVCLQTKEDHEIPGYGGLYLGHGTKLLALLMGLMGGYGVILAYMIAQGQILQALFGGSPTLWSLAFFLIGGAVVYRGLNAVRIIELVVTIGVASIIGVIGIAAHPHVDGVNLAYGSLHNLLVPYGVYLFALSGIVVIPQLRQQVRRTEKMLPWVIVTANVAIVALYAFFLWLVLGVTGQETTAIATIGLGRAIGPVMFILGNTLAVCTIFSCFIGIGLSVRRVFQYDYGFTRLQAWLSTMMIPLVLFLVGARDFIAVVGIVGGVVLGVQNSVVILAYWRARHAGDRKPEFDMGRMRLAGALVLGLYVLGAVCTVLAALT